MSYVKAIQCDSCGILTDTKPAEWLTKHYPGTRPSADEHLCEECREGNQ